VAGVQTAALGETDSETAFWGLKVSIWGIDEAFFLRPLWLKRSRFNP
jgi:hypothetical protein